MTRVREIARRVSNWGRWGADDERGTVNFITPDVVCRAAAYVRRGAVPGGRRSVRAGARTRSTP